MKSVILYELGFIYKQNNERREIYSAHPEILPKEKKPISTGHISPADQHAKKLTEDLKNKISRLYIKHNVGNDYIYRRIGFFKKKIKNTGILE